MARLPKKAGRASSNSLPAGPHALVIANHPPRIAWRPPVDFNVYISCLLTICFGELMTGLEPTIYKCDTICPDGLISALYKAKDVTLKQVWDELPRLRREFGIPPAPSDLNPNDTRSYGGWWVKIPWPRRIDFKRYGNEPPVLSGMLQELSKNASSVARQLRALRTTGYEVDEALILVIAWREAGFNAFGNEDRLVDSYKKGGLDHFHREMNMLRPLSKKDSSKSSSSYLPEEFPKLLQKSPLYGRQSPEYTGSRRIRPVYPAMIPVKHMVEAYGARINWTRDIFIKVAEKGQQNPKSLDSDPLRAWIAAWFAGPGSCKLLMDKIKRKRTTLEAITDPSFTKQYLIPDTKELYNPIKTGLVRAAEAQLLQKLVKGVIHP